MMKYSILLIFFVFMISVSNVGAVIIYDDGQTHQIDFETDEGVEVFDDSDSNPTTLNLVTGAELGHYLWGNDKSIINMYDGVVSGGGFRRC